MVDSGIFKKPWIKWLRTNLFSGVFDSIVTVVLVCLTAYAVTAFLGWGFFNADFVGNSASSCTSGGACWVFIKERLVQFAIGFYPEKEAWRVIASALFLSVAIFGVLSGKLGSQKKWLLVSSSVLPVSIWFFLEGGFWGLTRVETSQWGGLLVTVIVSFVGICFSLPLGILLALGRRSSLPVIRISSVLFIEFWRGVPLITVLFMSSVMIPVFLPESLQIDKLLRALLGVFFFSSAYMAEVVRGGLQAIASGQSEAAESLGLNYFQKMRFIVVPQALKLVIPGVVNNFIGLFKDTTLVTIIGMYDLLGMVQAANSDPDWLGYSAEGYIFAAAVFAAFCYGMSRYSKSIEARLRTSH